MRATLRLGWRNIWRNRRRTLVSMSAIGIGLMMVVVYGGLMAGIMGDSAKQLDTSGMGTIEVSAEGWRAHRNTSALIEDPAALIKKMQLPAGSEVASRMVLRGLISSARANEAVEVHGVDWEDEKKLAAYVRDVRQGELPKADDLKGILIGDTLAQRLHVGLGDKLRVMVQQSDSEMGAGLFRVRGLYHSISSGLSQHRVLISRAAAEQLFGAKGAHQVVIQLPVIAQADEIAAHLRTELDPKLEVMTYAQIVPIFKTLEALMDSAIIVASLFIYLLVGLGILNTMLMSVLERTREFGVMQAVGTRPSGILSLVLAESFWIATLSVALGLTLGLGLTWYGSHTALIDMTKTAGESVSFGGAVMGSAYKTRFSIADGLSAARYVYVMALFVGLYPAWRVSRMRPVDALRAR